MYEQRERVFHRDIQTRENNGEKKKETQTKCSKERVSSIRFFLLF